MTAKDWLQRAMYTDNEIKQLIAERDRAFVKATSPNQNIGGDKVQTSRRNISEEKFSSYAAYSELIEKRIDELYKIKYEILQAINSLDDSILRSILIARYINFKTWEEIAENLHYACRHIMRLHAKALIKINDVIECHCKHVV